MSVEIRTISSKEEAEQVAALAKEVWTEHYESIIGLDQVNYMIEKFQSGPCIYRDLSEKGYIYYVAEEGDRMVGYCAVHPEEGKTFLSKIYVLKSHRRQGIARRFVELVCGKAKERGDAFVYLTVNKENVGSIAAYEAMDFYKEKSICTDIGGGYVMDDYVMQRDL